MNVSPQTQAIVLLTVPFGKTEAKPLSIREWAQFAIWLKDHDLDPALLLKGDPKSLLADWSDSKLSVGRIEDLLNRGAALGLAMEKWQRAGLWIITRSEVEYPDRLKRRLRHDSPPVLFGSGNKALLSKGGIAVVGSRDADDDDLRFSTDIGQVTAQQGLSVVSGAARGVDESAMIGALQNEGTAVGVMADSLLRAATSAKYRKYLASGDLALVSPFNPEAGFNVGNAMARNKYIYCLSDAAVVVNSTPDKGGTWNGAIEDLKKQWVPLWVKRKDSAGSGNSALVHKGGSWFPEMMPRLSSLWEKALANGDETESKDAHLLSDVAANPVGAEIDDQGGDTGSSIATPASKNQGDNAPAEACAESRPIEQGLDFYRLFLERILEITAKGPLRADSIAKILELEKSQVSVWLTRGMADGEIAKLGKPVQYQAASAIKQQGSLFGN
jgi:predicted Rossmann fold nucleotide-binding protein DprA/Smf involved in DNA uptake